MNWKLRFKNKATLTALVGVFILFIKQITEMFGIDISNQLEQASGAIGTLITILAMLGVITDPTTKGVSDSGIVQTYNKPRKDTDTSVVYKSETKMKTPKTYDTAQPFSDDSDEIVQDNATGGSSYTEIDSSEHDLTNDKALVEGEEDENTSTN